MVATPLVAPEGGDGTLIQVGGTVGQWWWDCQWSWQQKRGFIKCWICQTPWLTLRSRSAIPQSSLGPTATCLGKDHTQLVKNGLNCFLSDLVKDWDLKSCDGDGIHHHFIPQNSLTFLQSSHLQVVPTFPDSFPKVTTPVLPDQPKSIHLASSYQWQHVCCMLLHLHL
jgi:hypothetical protein